MANYTLAMAAGSYTVTTPASTLLCLPRWRAGFIVTGRQPVIDVINDMLRVTCGGFIYWADGKWYARLDEQNVIGCRPVTTSAVGTTNRAQAFVAPGPRIKVVCKLNLAEGFSNPTLRLRSALAGADLATSTATGLTFANNQSVTFDLSTYRLTTGATYYLVLNATTGVTWHQCASGTYSGGASWDYVASVWTEEPTKDFWFQVHYADHEVRDSLTATSPEIPILASGGKSSLTFSRSREEAPNVVEVSYYDQSDWIVKSVRYEGATVQDGTKQPNTLSVQALAVPISSCAYRLARQWHKIAQRTNRAGCLVPQHGAIIAPGDVIVLTSVIGPVTSAWYRVRSVERRLGCFNLELVEYNWTDYSTEETFALDSITLPSTVSSTQYVSFLDDFRAGGGLTGDIGELGWKLTAVGGAGVHYVAEANHPGILRLESGYNNAVLIALDGTSQKFAEKSAWATEWIMKPVNFPTSGDYLYVADVFNVKIQNDAGVWTLYIDNVSTGKTCEAEWITVQNSCDGGETAYCNIAKGGVVWHQASKAVSSTTIDKYLSARTSNDYTGPKLDVDKARLSLGASR